MRIGDVAAAAGVSVRALRYYEEQGLLEAERSPSGQRLYPAGAVGRVRWIQLLYGAGLPSKAIVDLLPCVHTGVATPEMLSRLAAERDRIDQQVRDLTATRDRLEHVMAATQAYTAPSTASACTADARA